MTPPLGLAATRMGAREAMVRLRPPRARRSGVTLRCLVEIPRGSRNKYEYDEEGGYLVLDRRLFSSVVYPADYGYLEQTLTSEGRHLDALVLVNEPTFPGCRVQVRPVGLFRMRDEAGIDDKVLSVPVRDPEWVEVNDLDDIPQLLRDEIAHFFTIYKDLEPDRVVAIEGWADRAAAEQEIEECRERFVSERGGVGERA
jgi:inorganic pyrophosphatase